MLLVYHLIATLTSMKVFIDLWAVTAAVGPLFDLWGVFLIVLGIRNLQSEVSLLFPGI